MENRQPAGMLAARLAGAGELRADETVLTTEQVLTFSLELPPVKIVR